jgi:hypothetical protein
MGNSQSTPERKDSNRLSKVKGIQYNAQDPPSPPLDALPGQSGDPDLSVVPKRPALELLQQSPSQIRLQNASFVTCLAEPASREPNEEARDHKASVSKEASTGLLSKPPPGDAQSPSLPFDPKTIDMKTAVAILEELRKTASPEDLVALRMLFPIFSIGILR